MRIAPEIGTLPCQVNGQCYSFEWYKWSSQNVSCEKISFYCCFALFFYLEPLQGKISVFYWEYHCFYIQFRSWQLVTAILWDIKSAANASLFLLWRRMSAYSVWFVQPSNRHQWTEGSPSPTADWVVVQTAVWCVCWSQYNDALKSTLIKCLLGLNLTYSYTKTKTEHRLFQCVRRETVN